MNDMGGHPVPGGGWVDKPKKKAAQAKDFYVKETTEETVQRKLMLSYAVAFDFYGGDDDDGFMVRATRDVVEESGWGFIRHHGNLEPIADYDLCPRILVEHDGPKAKEGLAWIPLRRGAEMSDDFCMITRQNMLAAFALALELRDPGVVIPLKDDERLDAQITVHHNNPSEGRAFFTLGDFQRVHYDRVAEGDRVYVTNLREKEKPDALDQIYVVAQAWPKSTLLEPVDPVEGGS